MLFNSKMKMLQKHCIFVVVLLVQCVLCDSILGPCPKMKFMKKFDVEKFSGHWYEIERSFYLMEFLSSCVNVDLAVNNKEQLEVSINTKSTWSERFSISEGIAVQSRKHQSVWHYKVQSDMPKVINRYLPGTGNYQILKTDYASYAVLYSCTNYQLFHTDLVWIWGRNREINVKTRNDIYTLLGSYNIDSERLILPKNKNCTD